MVRLRYLGAFILLAFLSLPVRAQEDYSRNFFHQLGLIFGRFQDAELDKVFRAAKPIACSELIIDKGEWREVAFFNENRKLGDWYMRSLDEVKASLGVYTFKGICSGEHAAIQLATRFPVTESLDAYEAGRVSLSRIDIRTNAPVSAVYDPLNQAYTFELPYLFLISRKNEDVTYSLYPPKRTDKYDPEVVNLWDCKSVAASDVTYRFLICRTRLVTHNDPTNRQSVRRSFGANAYSILSDGKEAFSDVKLSFGPDNDPVPDATRPPPPETRTPATHAPATRTWQIADAASRLTEIAENEFRLRFDAQIWNGKIDKGQALSAGSLSAAAATSSQGRDRDSCVWRPGAAKQAALVLSQSTDDSSLFYTLGFRKEATAVSALFQIESTSGTPPGTLQCYFPASATIAEVTVGQWIAIVGKTIAIEIPR